MSTQFISFRYTETLTIPGTSSTAQFIFYDTQSTQIFFLFTIHSIFGPVGIGSFTTTIQLDSGNLIFLLIHVAKEQLSTSTADWLFMFGHYPVWNVGSNGPTQNLVTYLNPLLQKYNVDAYICGHEHNIQHIKDPNFGVNYYISGAGHQTSHKEDHINDVPPNSLKYFWPPSKQGNRFIECSNILQWLIPPALS